MANPVARYREIKAQLKELERELALIESSPEFFGEKEFLDKLQSLMEEYGKDLASIVSILEPKALADSPTQNRRRGARKRVTYKNPYTGEVVETAGGNNRVLKEWKSLYPSDNIKTWIVGEPK